jgi:signal transduction histidine kinase
LALAALVLVTAVAEALLRSDMVWRPVAPVVGLVLAFATLGRRTRPLAMVALGFGTFLAVDLAVTFTGNEPFSLFAGVSVLVLVYALFRWGTGRETTIGSVIVIAEWGVAVTTDSIGAIEAIVGLAVLLSVAALGVAVRYRRIVRRQQFERVRFHERDMLARELHDTVAHHVSAIAIQAQAGQVLARSGDLGGAADALAIIDQEASRTLTEMRSVVGTLRRGHDTPDISIPARRLRHPGPDHPRRSHGSAHRGRVPRRSRRSASRGPSSTLPGGPGVGHQRQASRTPRHPGSGPGDR